jgi:hypothetical protein
MTPVALVLLASCAMAANLESVRSEPNLERRSELAIVNADQALDEARKALESGEEPKLKAALSEVGESIALSKESLEQSGRNARRNPKYFKRAEIGIRRLIRRLETFKLEVNFDEREPVEKLIARAHDLQEGIMKMVFTKKKAPK